MFASSTSSTNRRRKVVKRVLKIVTMEGDELQPSTSGALGKMSITTVQELWQEIETT